MSAASGSLVRRLVAYQALDEFMPIFPVYALLFAENGLSTAQISSLLVLWSVVTLAFEVPSGAWADTVPRRLLLCLSSVAYGAAFATWVLVPTFSGFATGFVLWGLSSALSSGTFQALAYDELVAVGARHQYARVIGIGTSAALAAMALATLLATPLVAVGGYVLAGWVSVAVCAARSSLLAHSPPHRRPSRHRTWTRPGTRRSARCQNSGPGGSQCGCGRPGSCRAICRRCGPGPVRRSAAGSFAVVCWPVPC